MIFQDPMSALNPVMTVGSQVAEAARAHGHMSRAQARARGLELLDLVNIPEPKRRFDAYPHQFSGGMRQRAMIALALAGEPQLLIADEPTTALDVTVQAQVLHELRELQELRHLALILITHNMAIVANACDRVLVMYGGRIVEQGEVAQILGTPVHPYTTSLLLSVPSLTASRSERLLAIDGSPYDLHDAPAGCSFEHRCPLAIDECRRLVPPLEEFGSGREVACFRADESGSFGSRRRQDPVAVSVIADQQSEPVPLLALRHLRKSFRVTATGRGSLSGGTLNAVDGVTLDIGVRETLGLVGESGCGKSTLARTVVKILEPTSGSLIFDGQDITNVKGAMLRSFRRRVQMVFQDPYGSLNPRMGVGDAIAEPLIYRQHKSARDARDRAAELLSLVGLPAAAAGSLPYQLSGGQRQRVGIARALAVEPSMLVCDEPVSALDVSMQAQIINLFRDLQTKLGLSYLFISHDLAVVRHLADRVAVMYLGQVVELGPSESICAEPLHPYTLSVLASVPDPNPRRAERRAPPPAIGEPASPLNPPAGCRFHPRCPIGPRVFADREICAEQAPALTEIEPGRYSACHFAQSLSKSQPVAMLPDAHRSQMQEGQLK
jgi:peptide/nickel transport system ATP-binding protein